MLGEIADVSLPLGLIDDARGASGEALRVATAIEDRRITRLSLLGLAKAARVEHDYARVGFLWGWVAEEERVEPLLSRAASYGEYVSELAQETRPKFLDRAENRAALPWEEIVELAMGRTDASQG